MWTFNGSRRIQALGIPVERILTRHDIGYTRIDPENLPIVVNPMWRNLSSNQWDEDFVNTMPTIYNNLVLFANDRHQIFCHDLKTGDLLWDYQGDKPYQKKGLSALLPISNSFLCVSSYDGTLCKIDVNTGIIIWKKYLDNFLHSTSFIDQFRNCLYIGTEGKKGKSGNIVCVDLDTAQTKWIFKTNDQIPCSPTLIDNKVICGSNDENLYAVDPDTGEPVWMVEKIGAIKGRAAFIEDVILVSTETGKLIGIGQDGKVLWARTCGTKTRHQFLQVHEKLRLVYIVNADGLVASYDKYGNQIWIRNIRSNGYWNIKLYQDELLIATVDGKLYLLDAATGKKVKYTNLGFKINCPPDFNNEFIAINSATQGFFVFRKEK